MSKLLLAAAALGLSLSAASAECAYHKSVQAAAPEKTVVASNDADAASAQGQIAAGEAKPADGAAQPAK